MALIRLDVCYRTYLIVVRVTWGIGIGSPGGSIFFGGFHQEILLFSYNSHKMAWFNAFYWLRALEFPGTTPLGPPFSPKLYLLSSVSGRRRLSVTCLAPKCMHSSYAYDWGVAVPFI